MKRIIAGILLAVSACAAPQAPIPLPADSLAAGQALARELRTAAPDESSETRATLIIHSGKVTTTVPVVCRVVVKDGNWETIYETSATANIGAEKLIVIHSTNGPNQYLYARAAQPGSSLPEPTAIKPADTNIPLAGSDFSLSDLGLQFLYWPQQQRFPDETRLGQACYVLESRNPEGSEGVKIRSDIDQETSGLLIATSYDSGGHVVKEFSLSSSGFKKVNGRWVLEKMDIKDKKKHSQTELKFDIQQ
ncbi:MAG TPA: outer membrane lipoprotein-sorting protein [Verrucomicrobiae bacterium]|jgi:hypothetical protein